MRRMFAFWWFATLPAFGQIELHLTFPVLEKILSEQVFTEEGRRYVKGARDNKCNFAFLEQPHIGESQGKLEVRARFSGRSALNVLGQCVGLGDSFGVVIRMTPYAEQATLRVRDVEVASDGKQGVYARRVSKALAEAIPRVLVRDLVPDFRRVLESPADSFPFRRAVDGVTVGSMEVTARAVVLRLALRMVVSP